MDTIAAISTPIGCSAIGIIRLSGEQSLKIALRFFMSKSISSEKDVVPGFLKLGHFHTDTLDEKCMMVYFKAPHSYTGEDMVEFHVHGGTFVVQSVLGVLLKSGARLAEKGEFTKRAFLSGKVSLSEAEGVAAMINATGEASMRSAYSMMSGRFDEKIATMTDKLIEVLSTLEAHLDYPEEMEDEAADGVALAEKIAQDMRAMLQGADQGKMIKDGVTVAICGKANVGKSSLLNNILGYSRAIVTDIPGTTRDMVEQSIVYKGIKLNLQDTAGLRDTEDKVEAMGIERSRNAALEADVVLSVSTKESGEEELLTQCRNVIKVNNKIDLYGEADGKMNICAKTGKGVTELLDRIVELSVGDVCVADVLTEERHIDCVRRALKALEEALKEAKSDMPQECMLVSLREAIAAITEISGGGATERVIDDVFSRFCVGK